MCAPTTPTYYSLYTWYWYPEILFLFLSLDGWWRERRANGVTYIFNIYQKLDNFFSIILRSVICTILYNNPKRFSYADVVFCVFSARRSTTHKNTITEKKYKKIEKLSICKLHFIFFFKYRREMVCQAILVNQNSAILFSIDINKYHVSCLFYISLAIFMYFMYLSFSIYLFI